ncbi:MAG: cytochrome C [Calditerrivibrio sp.]|nr:cytochrome C [Calditerrivibrio sp.]
MSGNKSSLIKKVYALIGIVILVYSSYIVYVLVTHIWHFEKPMQHSQDIISEEEKLFKEMVKEKKMVEYNLGYKVIKQEDLENHFHHVGNEVIHDNFNLCIKCHGDIPHDKNKAIRAFLNMHSDFFSCEVCHIRLEKNKKFIWYNKKDGKEVKNSNIKAYLSNSENKLLPLEYIEGKYERYDSDSKNKFVEEFRKVISEISSDKKSQGLKLIHRNVSKKPISCDECHSNTLQQSYLPLSEIGYKEERIVQILSNEVVGMVNKYKEFYIPNFLKPGTINHENSDKK